jgi:hypothetical protein
VVGLENERLQSRVGACIENGCVRLENGSRRVGKGDSGQKPSEMGAGCRKQASLVALVSFTVSDLSSSVSVSV